MEEASFTEAELAARVRVAPELVGRLVELGILGPGPYGLGDVRRARLVAACERAGLPLEGIGAAIAEGRLSLAFRVRRRRGRLRADRPGAAQGAARRDA